MKSLQRIAASAALLALASAAPMVAQSSATVNIGASAVIAGQAPIAVAANLDLLFGSAGAPVNAGGGATAATQRGLATVTGEPGMAFVVNFTLPTVLTEAGSGNTINITFGASDGIDYTDFAAGTINTTFDPRVTYNAVLNAAGVKEIGLDGSINPPLGTISGTYSGVVTIDVAY